MSTETGRKSSVAERFKSIRLNEGLKQTEFAKKLGVRQASISYYENGTRTLDDDMINLVCRIFGYDRIWLKYGLGNSPLDCREKELQRIHELLELMNTEKLVFARKMLQVMVGISDSDQGGKIPPKEFLP